MDDIDDGDGPADESFDRDCFVTAWPAPPIAAVRALRAGIVILPAA